MFGLTRGRKAFDWLSCYLMRAGRRTLIEILICWFYVQYTKPPPWNIYLLAFCLLGNHIIRLTAVETHPSLRFLLILHDFKRLHFFKVPNKRLVRWTLVCLQHCSVVLTHVKMTTMKTGTHISSYLMLVAHKLVQPMRSHCPKSRGIKQLRTQTTAIIQIRTNEGPQIFWCVNRTSRDRGTSQRKICFYSSKLNEQSRIAFANVYAAKDVTVPTFCAYWHHKWK